MFSKNVLYYFGHYVMLKFNFLVILTTLYGNTTYGQKLCATKKYTSGDMFIV